MRNLCRHCWGRHPRALASLLPALVVAALALAGCGGDSGTTTTSARGTTSTQEPSSVQPGGESAEAKKADRKALRVKSSPSKGGGKQAAKPDNGAKHEAHHRNAGGNSKTGKVGSGHCPNNITRAQCKAYVEQPVGDEPSHSVNTPESCGQAMSQKACEEQFEAEQAGKGQSVDAEHCLEEESRAQCEAQLGPQIEAERESRNE